MKIDDSAVRPSRPVTSTPLSSVNERLGERDAVRDVVGTAGPLEAAGVERRAPATAGPSSML